MNYLVLSRHYSYYTKYLDKTHLFIANILISYFIKKACHKTKKIPNMPLRRPINSELQLLLRAADALQFIVLQNNSRTTTAQVTSAHRVETTSGQ